MKKVSDNLFRGARPKSLEELKESKIKAIINLQSGFHEAINNDEYEKLIPEMVGIMSIEIPCSDFVPPPKYQVDVFLDVVKKFGPAFVHCLHGRDRTGYMIACYRMQVEGWKAKDAIKEMLKEGFHWFPYFYWIPSLYKYEVK